METPIILIHVRGTEPNKLIRTDIIYGAEVTTILRRYDPTKSEGANHECAAEEARIGAGAPIDLVGMWLSDDMSLWRARDKMNQSAETLESEEEQGK